MEYRNTKNCICIARNKSHKNDNFHLKVNNKKFHLKTNKKKNNLIFSSHTRQDSNKVHPILNDLLETEYVLIADLIQSSCGNSSIAHQIKSLLEESISSLIQDLIENPNCLKNNYFNELKVILPEIYIQSFRDLHFNLFLKLENKSLNEFFKDKQLLEIKRDGNTIFSSLVDEICSSNGFLVKLLNCTRDPDFTGWKFFFILLDHFLIDRIDDGTIKSNGFFLLIPRN